jgi:ech hydrogenase subunit E
MIKSDNETLQRDFLKLINPYGIVLSETQDHLHFEVEPDNLIPLMKTIAEKYTSLLITIDLRQPDYISYALLVMDHKQYTINILLTILLNHDKINYIPSVTHYFPNGIMYERELSKYYQMRFSNQVPFSQVLLSKEKEIEYETIQSVTKADVKYFKSTFDDSKYSKYSFWISFPPIGDHENFRFQFLTHENKILTSTLRMGFSYYPIEKAIVQRPVLDNFQTIEKLCGLCSIAHHLAYSLAIESALKINDEIPERALGLRVLLAELERAQNHLLWIGFTLQALGLSLIFKKTWKIRLAIINLLENMTGRKLTYSTITVGGVSKDIQPNLENIDELCKLEKELILLREEIMDQSVVKSIIGVGVLEHNDTSILGTVGPIARASGSTFDVRKTRSYASYKEIPFVVQTLPNGDMNDNLMMKINESIESIKICSHLLNNLPKGTTQISVEFDSSSTQAFSHVEAPSGHLTYYINLEGNKVNQIKIRTPTIANIPSLLYRLKGSDIKYIPLILRGIEMGIDPMEKVTFIEDQSQIVRIMKGSEFRAITTKSLQTGSALKLFSG